MVGTNRIRPFCFWDECDYVGAVLGRMRFVPTMFYFLVFLGRMRFVPTLFYFLMFWGRMRFVPTMFYFLVTRTDTWRFFSRPSGVLLVATGNWLP